MRLRPGLWRDFLTSKEGVLLSVSATLRFLSYPPYPFGFLIFPSLVLLFFALDRKSPRQTLSLAYFWGVLSNALLLYWFCWATVPWGILAMVPLGAFPMIPLFIFSLIQKRSYILSWLALPFLWVGMEYLRSVGELVFPWTNLGYTQSFYLPVVQFITFTGVYGLSFWVMAVALLLFGLIRALGEIKGVKAVCYVLSILLLIIVPYLHGRNVMRQPTPSGSLKVGLLQGNISQDVKWDPQHLNYSFDTFFQLSREAARNEVDLVVWPETSAPCYLSHNLDLRTSVQSLVDELEVPFLVGAPEYKRLGARQFVYYNAAFYLRPGEKTIGSYYKNRLVPFSERIPFSDRVNILSDVHLGQADFSPGTELTIFDHPKGNFGVLICYESAFPGLVRGFVRKGADFLVNITNDGWFGKTSGPHQHAAMAIFRAIENRISIARCANTGVSMIVDQFGRTHQATELYTRTLVVGEVHSKGPTTFYSRYGDLFVYCCLGIGLALLVASLFCKPREEG
jgi:apolipoprotein N-acyltransferase